MVRVKICGITSIEDAAAAVAAGADALGFVFAESPRKVDIERASAILSRIPPFIATVGVFAGEDAEEVYRIMETTRLHFAQLHGPGLGSLVSKPRRWGIIRAVRVKCPADVEQALDDELIWASSAILLDSYVEGKMGGTGQPFDWQLALQWKQASAGLKHCCDKPLILAGGLTPANVAEAVKTLKPYAVDVSTGVEAYPGKKDHQKIKEFVINAKETF